MKHTFKVGDKVRCIDDSDSSLIKGLVYRIKAIDPYICLESTPTNKLGHFNRWRPDRFEKVTRKREG